MEPKGTTGRMVLLLNRRSILFFGTANRDQADLLASKLDLIFIAGLQFQQSGVGLTNQKIAVALMKELEITIMILI